VKRLAKTVYIRLRASVVRHIGNAVFRTQCPHEDDSASAPLAEFLTEMVGDVQMRDRIKPQGLVKQLPIMLQELAGISGAGIGDDKTDFEILCSFFDRTDKLFIAQIHLNRSTLYAKLVLEILSQLIKQFEPSGD